MDKLPPQSLELEQVVLGAILLENNAINEVINILHDKCFYSSLNAEIWRVMTRLYNSGNPIDTLTVLEGFKRDKQDVALYLTELVSKVGSSAHIEAHALVVKEKYLKRTLIEIQQRSLKKLYEDDDFFEIYDGEMTELTELIADINRIKQEPFSDIVFERVKELKQAANDKSYRTGVPSYLEPLDRQTMGFQRGDLVIIAGRPSMGKTALAIDFARNELIRGVPVGFFSLEMSSAQIVDRMIAGQTGIDLRQIRRGGMQSNEWQRLDEATSQMIEFPIQICDKGGLTINEIVSISKNWKIKSDIQIIYIDYLQLISFTEKKNINREQEVSNISRRLKQLAKDINVPVIALSQLSRACEARTDKRPMLSDLRESGSIEQDADMVIFPFREDYYSDAAEKGRCELNIAKFRNGKTGMVECAFNLETQTFKELNDF